MTEEEYVQKLKDACASGDTEIAHSISDEILCDAIEQLGWTDLASEFRKQSKDFWYA